MHDNLPKFFYFINEFDKEHIRKLDKKIAIIYRNYSEKYDEKKILKIKKFCKLNRLKFFLANSVAIVNKLNLDGVYIPSFNRDLSSLKLKNKNIKIIGSAHNLKEISQKNKQGVELIFISPVFKINKSKNHLGVTKFNFLTKNIKCQTIALGGINSKNIKKIKILNCSGIASISFIKKYGKVNLIN